MNLTIDLRSIGKSSELVALESGNRAMKKELDTLSKKFNHLQKIADAKVEESERVDRLRDEATVLNGALHAVKGKVNGLIKELM